MSQIFDEMRWADGQINPSGIKSILFYAPKDFIKTVPVVAAAPATSEENVLLEGDFEMVAGKTFTRLQSEKGKGKLDFEPVGEGRHKMFINKGMFVYPDVDYKSLSLAKNSVNSDMVYVVGTPHESEWRFHVLGHRDFETDTKVKGGTGDAPGSDKGTTIEVEAPDTTPLPRYAGVLKLSDGDFDCATGVLTPSA